jgi:hypothetical protein
MGHRRTILHINMLKKWESRVETINVATLDDELVEGEEKI